MDILVLGQINIFLKKNIFMTIFKKIKEAINGPSTEESHLYARVANEVSQGIKDEGLWAMAMAESGFDEQKGKARYMALRVVKIKQENAKEVSRLAEISRLRAKADLSYKNGEYKKCLETRLELIGHGEIEYLLTIAKMYSNGEGCSSNIPHAFYLGKLSSLHGIRREEADAFTRSLIPRMMSWDIEAAIKKANEVYGSTPNSGGSLQRR